jgi:23S rRNA pseudouridine1911/1915/1917 synthase
LQKWHFELMITTKDTTISVRQYLSKHLLIPRHLVSALRKNHRVLVNQKYQPMNVPLNVGDIISLDFTPIDFKLPVQNIIADNTVKPTILYEDADLLIVNKPQGYKTHPNQPMESHTVINFCESYLNAKGQHVYMVHRLDKYTSGAIIFGKNPAVVPILIRLIQAKSIHRTYLAWTWGHFTKNHGTINLPIGFDDTDQRKRKVDGRDAKEAQTDYEIIRTTEHHSLIKLKLHTGRTHQIRVHMAAIGHPIVGDPLYNTNSSYPHMLLHSWQLKLIRPFYCDTRTITSNPPDYFKNFPSIIEENESR